MKKLIGVIVILLTLHVCLYFYLSTHRAKAKAKPEAAFRPQPLLNRLIFTALFLQ